MFVGGKDSPGDLPRATCPHPPYKHLFYFGKHSKRAERYLQQRHQFQKCVTFPRFFSSATRPSILHSQRNFWRRTFWMRSKNGEKRLLMTVSIRPYVLSNLNDASSNISQGFCKRCSFQCFSERNMTNSLNFKLRNCGTGNVVVDSLNRYMDIKRLKKRLIFEKRSYRSTIDMSW